MGAYPRRLCDGNAGRRSHLKQSWSQRQIALDMLILFLPAAVRALAPNGPFFATMLVPIFWILIVRRTEIRVDAVTGAGVVLVAISYLSAVSGVDPEYSVRIAHVIALSVAYIIALAAYFSSRSNSIVFALGAFWAIGVLHAVYFAASADRRVLRVDETIGRSALEGLNSNVSGWILAVCIWAGLMFLVLRGRGATGGLWLVGTLLSGCGFMFLQLLATGSRTSLGSVILGVGVLALKRIPRAVHWMAILSLLTAIAVSVSGRLLASAVALGARLPFFTDLSQYRGVDGLNGRAALWMLMQEYTRSLPLLGEGHAAYRNVLGGNLTTHNFVFEAWTGMGLVGLAVYCVFLLAILLTPWRLTGRERSVSMLLVGSAFMLLIPTLLASTQHWAVMTSAILGLCAIHLRDLNPALARIGKVGRTSRASPGSRSREDSADLVNATESAATQGHLAGTNNVATTEGSSKSDAE